MSYLYNLGLAFEAVAAEHAARPALIMPDGTAVTYRELDRLAKRVARGLLAQGAIRGDIVGIFNSKTTVAFATMLAALKIGAAYVNLDDQNPAQRLGAMLRTCRPRLVAHDAPLPAPLMDLCRDMGLGPVDLNALADEALPDERLRDTDNVTGNTAAYLMFTSGSTGIPKAVTIAHSSVLNLVQWSRTQFGISPDDVLTNVNPVYFDNSVFDFYSAIFNGAALAPFTRDVVSQPALLVSKVEELGCTLWFSVPTLLIYLTTLKQLGARSWPRMRCLVFGGEGYPKSELKKLFDLFGKRANLVNVYGPTECTCICSAYTLRSDDFVEPAGLPPLGEIAPNFDYLILDEAGQPVERGEAGELCLLGPQVGLGYCNDAERTAASFVSNPLNPVFHERMYRSGDLVREYNDGLLWFVGRKDNQIKHMGYRIELEEIEAALNAMPGVVRAAAVYQRVREQHGHIVAFVAGTGIAEDVLRGDLGARLPAYMIPARIVFMPDLPRNANGKVDRKALLASLA